MMDHLFDRPRQFLDHLELLGPAARAESFMNEAMETGGSFPDPNNEEHWTARGCEIVLHGITARGRSETDAIRNWMCMARRKFAAAADAWCMPRHTSHPPAS